MRPRFPFAEARTASYCYYHCYYHLRDVHLCLIEQSRRDDVESIAYIMMYFLRGSLPWQGLRAATKKQKYDRISEKKMSTSVDELCKGFSCE